MSTAVKDIIRQNERAWTSDAALLGLAGEFQTSGTRSGSSAGSLLRCRCSCSGRT